MITFNLRYFACALLIFLLEVLIAIFINDQFIRPYLGDVLVVILIYCFLKSFVNLKVFTAAVFVLAFSFLIELLQFFSIVEKLHLEDSKMARTVIGTSFSWMDLVCYITGIAIVLFVEKYWLDNEITNESKLSNQNN